MAARPLAVLLCSALALLKTLVMLLMSIVAGDASVVAASGDDCRPWDDPTFDPTQPSAPMSYPITSLAALASGEYFKSFHFPFNRASVPLAGDGVLPRRPRLLVCHDLEGGYRDDLFVQGGANEGAYTIWHWRLMDVFVYFSHYLVTLPPPGWVNAAHTHGVKVLGTFLTEWDEGKKISEEILATSVSAKMYAERLAELADALGFDGWLINMEVNLNAQLIDNLKKFIGHLSQIMHSKIPGSLVIWYDAVAVNGSLNWQDQLNDMNKPFFDLCDGIFVNYAWKENFPKLSAARAGDRKYDVYMGIDVFGRNTFGGGQWNTNKALDVLKKDDVSAAIFAPGWVYQTKQGPDFQTAQNRWWNLVEKSWGQLQMYPKVYPFYSNFDQGHGFQFSVQGTQVSSDPWNNMSCQGFQPITCDTTDSFQIFTNFQDTPYSGGGSLTIKGHLQPGSLFSSRIFNASLALGNSPVQILYSVKSDETSLVGLSLQLSSDTVGDSYALVADNATSFPSLEQGSTEHYKLIQAEKRKNGHWNSLQWVQYEAILHPEGQTLNSIYAVFAVKSPSQHKSGRKERLILTGSRTSYDASIGYISINKVGENTTFPDADAWSTQGHNISLTESSNGAKFLSFKLSWTLKEGPEFSYAHFNIYVIELKDGDKPDIGSSKNLGVASVEAFYISKLEVPEDVISLLFIIQACSYDGSTQELTESPTFLLSI